MITPFFMVLKMIGKLFHPRQTHVFSAIFGGERIPSLGGGSKKKIMLTPKIGEDSHFLTNVFQLG